jgi:transglutaminase-like putative cysteine protease
MTAGEYYEYKDRSVSRSPEFNDYATMRQYVTPTDRIVIHLATVLEGLAQNRSYDNEHTMDFMLAFVQNIGYSFDNVSTGHEDYWRYSVETLWDHTGDCEDLSILFASLLEATGHDAVLLLFTGASHMAVGADCPGASGTYFTYDSVRYFYCETTAPGWLVGEEPPEIAGNMADVVQVP